MKWRCSVPFNDASTYTYYHVVTETADFNLFYFPSYTNANLNFFRGNVFQKGPLVLCYLPPELLQNLWAL